MMPAENDTKSARIGIWRVAKWEPATYGRPGFSLIRQKQWPIACFRAGSLKQFESQN
jgi:hypothetical protein